MSTPSDSGGASPDEWDPLDWEPAPAAEPPPSTPAEPVHGEAGWDPFDREPAPAPSEPAVAPLPTGPPPAAMPPPTGTPLGHGAARPTAPAEAPRKLHPISIVRGFGVAQIIGWIPAVIVLGVQSDSAVGLAVLIPLVLVVGVATSVVRWTRHTYELRDGRIIERSGLLSRSERSLEIARIQQVDVTRTLLDRVVGTCELRLETAADSSESELTLRVVAVDEADRLRTVLAAAQSSAATASTAAITPAVATAGGAANDGPVGVLQAVERLGAIGERLDASEEVLVAVPLTHVVLAAVTGRRLVAIPVALAALLGLLGDAGVFEEALDGAEDAALRLGLAGIVAVVLVGLLLSLVIAAVVGALRDGGFVLARRGDDLQVRRGLTTTRSATVPMRRVQRITVRRSWLHTRMGYASVTIHSAGGVGAPANAGPAAAADRSLTVPLLAEAEVERLVTGLLAVDAVPPLHAHPPAARIRIVLRAVLGSAGLVVPLLVTGLLVPEAWGLSVAALLVAVSTVPVGLRRYRQLASGASTTLLASRTGLLGTTLALAPVRKVQGSHVRASLLQRRRQLASLSLHVAGPAGGITMHDIADATAHALADRLVR